MRAFYCAAYCFVDLLAGLSWRCSRICTGCKVLFMHAATKFLLSAVGSL